MDPWEDHLFSSALRRLESRDGVTTSESARTAAFDGCDKSTNAQHPHTAYLRALWQRIASRAEERGTPVYLYGAGEHSRWWLSITDDLSMPQLAGFLDDEPSGESCAGYPVVRASSAELAPGTIVVISSDRHEHQMFHRARGLFPSSVEIVRPYEGMPPGPYPRPPSPEAIARRIDATRDARRRWGGDGFVGPYERAGYVTGFLQEQWLWSQRDLICGRVLDMSTPRHWHRWVYELPSVTKVSVSDLDGEFVVKDGFASRVDIRGDFCATPPPAGADSFDAALCLSILEHCQEPAAMLTNLRHTLADGGHLLLVVPFACPDGHCRPDYWRFGRDGLTLLAERVGFDDIRTGGLGDVGPQVADVLGIPTSADDHHDGIPLLTWLTGRT